MGSTFDKLKKRAKVDRNERRSWSVWALYLAFTKGGYEGVDLEGWRNTGGNHRDPISWRGLALTLKGGAAYDYRTKFNYPIRKDGKISIDKIVAKIKEHRELLLVRAASRRAETTRIVDLVGRLEVLGQLFKSAPYHREYTISEQLAQPQLLVKAQTDSYWVFTIEISRDLEAKFPFKLKDLSLCFTAEGIIRVVEEMYANAATPDQEDA